MFFVRLPVAWLLSTSTCLELAMLAMCVGLFRRGIDGRSGRRDGTAPTPPRGCGRDGRKLGKLGWTCERRGSERLFPDMADATLFFLFRKVIFG